MGWKEDLARFKRMNPNAKVDERYGASNPTGDRKAEYMRTRKPGEGYEEWLTRKGYRPRG